MECYPFLWKIIWKLACKSLPNFSGDTLFDMIWPSTVLCWTLIHLLTKHWPRARLHMTETKLRMNQTDPASILSKYIAHTWRQLQEQLGNHRMNEKWHVEQNSRNVEVLWMKVREKGRLSERPILELERDCSKKLWGHGSKWQTRDSTKTCWDENEEEQCD